MRNYKAVIIWTIIIATFVTFCSPALPANASALGNLLGNSGAPASLGTGFFNALLSILLGLTNILHPNPGANDNAGPPDKANPGGKEVLGFYAEWWDGDNSSYTSLVRNADAIKAVIPFWATLQPDGSLSSRGGKDRARVVNFARQNKIDALLMVNNAHQSGLDAGIQSLLASAPLRKTAIDNLEKYIKTNNLNGVNIDFELVPPAARDDLTTFIRELSNRLKPQGYSVSIDVFPKTDENSDVAAAYDYAGLARHADKIIIMTYDNHGQWSGPGPVAGIGWVEANLKYALQFIPRQKLYLGVAGYGYDWSSKGVESLEYKTAVELASRYNAAIKWDNDSQSPYFHYTDKDGIKHDVWFENSYSTSFKLDLVNKYDLAGIALWKLGEEDPRDWQLYRDKLLNRRK